MIQYRKFGTEHTGVVGRVVYCGRGRRKVNMLTYGLKPFDPGWLGNPFDAAKHGLENCIGMYARAFMAKLASDRSFREALWAIRRQHEAGQLITLVCWCEPEALCHTQVIRAWLEGLK